MLGPQGFSEGALSVVGGVIAAGGGRDVDVSGYVILPGIVDLHGDGFERHLAPRRGARGELAAGLAASDAEMAANGITTGTLAQFSSWEGGMRGPDFAEALADALAGYPARTDLHLQLRLETHPPSDYARAEALIARAGIGYVVLNDHLPHRALAAGKRPPRLTGQALKAGRSPEAHLAHLQDLHATGPDVPGALDGLCARLIERGVRIGSHDDPDADTRATMRARGVRIAEFPETPEAAGAAHDAGDAVIMGAPNVVRGGSHDGKVSARDLIALGQVDALVSDYHYPALWQAALALVDGGMAWAKAWHLISAGPAAVMGWDDRGVLAPGKRADLLVLHAASRQIEGVLAQGRVSYLVGRLAAQFLEAR